MAGRVRFELSVRLSRASLGNVAGIRVARTAQRMHLPERPETHSPVRFQSDASGRKCRQPGGLGNALALTRKAKGPGPPKRAEAFHPDSASYPSPGTTKANNDDGGAGDDACDADATSLAAVETPWTKVKFRPPYCVSFDDRLVQNQAWGKRTGRHRFGSRDQARDHDAHGGNEFGDSIHRAVLSLGERTPDQRR